MTDRRWPHPLIDRRLNGRRSTGGVPAAAWLLGCALFLAALLSTAAQARTPISESKPFAEHFLLLQLSDADPAKHALILSVANNLLEHYGPDQIDIEVVTFGPGVRLLYADAPLAKEVNSLVAQGVRFAVCMNTIDTIARDSGKAPALNDNAIPVQVGVSQILKRVEEGYTLVRP